MCQEGKCCRNRRLLFRWSNCTALHCTFTGNACFHLVLKSHTVTGPRNHVVLCCVTLIRCGWMDVSVEDPLCLIYCIRN